MTRAAICCIPCSPKTSPPATAVARARSAAVTSPACAIGSRAGKSRQWRFDRRRAGWLRIRLARRRFAMPDAAEKCTIVAGPGTSRARRPRSPAPPSDDGHSHRRALSHGPGGALASAARVHEKRRAPRRSCRRRLPRPMPMRRPPRRCSPGGGLRPAARPRPSAAHVRAARSDSAPAGGAARAVQSAVEPLLAPKLAVRTPSPIVSSRAVRQSLFTSTMPSPGAWWTNRRKVSRKWRLERK